ncbi:MAG: stability/partitioning determinant [Saprospiraceae bacterium]
MTAERASMFGDDDLDLSAFQAAPAGERPKISKDAIRTAAAERGFISREPEADLPLPAPARQRRYTTGRNRQLNLKVTEAALQRFYALADQQGWVLGETFEMAVNALAAKIGGGA